MSPATGDYLLFLHSMRHRRGQPVYDAIDLTPWAEHRPDGWFGWLAYGSAEPEAVRVLSPHLRVVHARGPAGSFWSVEGERVRDLGPAEQLRAQVETRASIGLSPPRVVPLPAFVSRRRRMAAPVVHAAVVRLEDVSVATFADAFLNLEIMDAVSHGSGAEMGKALAEDVARSGEVRSEIRGEVRGEARSARRWGELRRATVPAGTMVPAEVVVDDRAVGCVLRLGHPAGGSGGSEFRCMLFLAAAAPLARGAMLRRRSGLWPPGRPPRLLERVVGTVLWAGPAQPLPSVLPESAPEAAPPSASARALKLRCLSCGASPPLGRYGAEAMEVAELTALWHRSWKELALLNRTADLYRRHPEARGCVKPAHDWIMDSANPVAADPLMNDVPSGPVAPPRPPDYEDRIEEWLGDDPELREFLETHSFDLEARTRVVQGSERKYREHLGGRSVRCPACGDGLLAVADAPNP